jgi:hypothetical protein
MKGLKRKKFKLLNGKIFKLKNLSNEQESKN